ncbi:hypothetical protein MKEN_00867200 [Mycena kentingensis (nom. inval.)]|nr:hypothetical protein MKEN_00867200 [Mycena kentingensis (nom. inval.)]
MTDGSRLRQSWYTALDAAETQFRQLLTSSSSAEWKRLSASTDPASAKKGKARMSGMPELADVVVHRNSTKAGGDVYRLVLDVPTGDDTVSLEPWKAVLTTPEMRQEWDPAVEDAHLVEMFDHNTRICKTNFTLGWPANPRDAVTISRSFHDASTFIDISTSLPRSIDEPAYLRPSPPYVRSHVTLFAWCIQHLAPPPQLPASPTSEGTPRKRPSPGGRLRITCFSQHDLRTAWNLSTSSAALQQLSTMALGLFKTVVKRGVRIPKITGYGNGVSIDRIRYQVDREALTIDYAIIPEEEDHGASGHGIDELHALREGRRLRRSIECVLPAAQGWDVQVSVKASSEEVERLPWSVRAIRSSSFPSSTDDTMPLDQIVVRLTHAPLIDEHSLLKVRVVVEISGPTAGLRLNGLPQIIQDVEERDPSSYFISQQILQDVSSTADLSFNTASSLHSGSSIKSTGSTPSLPRPPTDRTVAAEKSILSRVKRNYIYFSSLLQEPEAKWRRTTEAKGVSVSQLDSIDPTLVVYRAEATFVGVGLWDLYGAIVSPGAKSYWDKQHEDAVLLEDVNDLTELWHIKTKPAWPVNGRDSVVLKTVYKAPTTIHVFAFSADDPHLFPNIPPADPTIIRTQIDLQGWAIETLSPTTTLLTLLEQSDPKGWTNKTSIPNLMINTLAGIGEFAIKCGGPPFITRLAGAKANSIRYDHEKSSFKIEYEASTGRQLSTSSSELGTNSLGASGLPVIECELRCDMDTWAPSLDIVVDPPPQSISCLRRHRLSTEGGGLWLTLTHDAVFVDDERLLVIVRRAPGKEKGLIMVNGSKIAIDVEELPDSEIKSLTKRKRVKPARIPLDQPPVVGVIRRRKAEWDVTSEESAKDSAGRSGWATAPRLSSPLSRFFTYAVDQASSTTQSAVAAITPPGGSGDDAAPSSSKMPMQYALEALAWTQRSHSHGSSDVNWTSLNDKTMSIRRKLFPEISPVIQVHKGEKVIQGVSAEELAAIVTEYNCRKKWDERFDSATVLESYGAHCQTAFVVAKAGFPFRDRGFYLASVLARAHVAPSSRRPNGDVAEQSNGGRNAIFYVSASFSSDSATRFSTSKYNPSGLPIGRVFVDAWILETLDPYTKENYAIPSTRCTYMIAMDYAGAIPAAFNSMINAAAPRAVIALEAYFKSISSLPITRLPPAGLVISDKDAHEPFAITSYKVRRRDEQRTLVHTKYQPEDRVYRTTVFLNTQLPSSPALSHQQTPRPSRLTLSPGRPEGSLDGLPSPGSDNTLSPQSGIPSSSSALFVPSPGRERAASTSTMSGHSREATIRPRTESMQSSPRQRTESATSATSVVRELRGRTSSAFTLKGEVKTPTDLLVAELVVDSKLYPEGYNIGLRTWLRSDIGVGPQRRYIALCASTASGEKADALPIATSVHTMPSSPNHSSGLTVDKPTRHLVKFTLPTAQYQISTVRDPLTDELRGAPPKPPWLLALEEGGAVVEVEVRPGGKSGVVAVDGKDVAVVNEKEALTTLGRDELLDDRISKMSVLSRTMNEAEILPEQLKVPVAVADTLLDVKPLPTVTGDGEKSKELQDGHKAEEGKEAAAGTPPADAPTTTPVVQPTTTPTGILSFMTRFASQNPNAGAAASLSKSPMPGGLGDVDVPHADTRTASGPRTYGLSQVVIIALIAFLIGSLFRSLLSPADFIYVVRELEEGEEKGWREIRRLIEVKYVAGGYDLNVALLSSASAFLASSSTSSSMTAVAPPAAAPSTPADPSPAAPQLSWEGDKMFNIYIYDYCFKRGFRKTARELLLEADIPQDSTPPINARQGLLFEWWSVFWVLFTAKANGNGTEEAMLYTQHQANQAAMRSRPPQQMPGGGMIPQPGGPMVRPGVNGVGRGFPPNGVMPNGVPGGQPPGPTSFAGHPMPNGIMPGGPPPMGPGPQPNFNRNSISGPPRPPPNGVPPFQSPTMAHSPPNSGHPPQGSSQPPMGGLNRGMLPPGMGPGPGGQPGPSPYPPNMAGRPGTPGRVSTPQPGGPMNHSPSLAPRVPPMLMGSVDPRQHEMLLNNELQAIPQAVINGLKAELGIGEKSIPSLTVLDKQRIIQTHRNRTAKPQPNAAAGPSSGPPQQRRNKRNSTSPPEDLQGDDGSSPPNAKKMRTTPDQPPIPTGPMGAGYPPQPGFGQGGPGPGGGGMPMANGAMMGRPMGGPMGGPMGSPMGNGFPQNMGGQPPMAGGPMGMLAMGGMPGGMPGGGMPGGMSPQMNPGMMYRPGMHPGGGMPQRLPSGPKPMGMLPPPSPAKDQNAVGKDANKPGSSPRNQPITGGPTQPGTGPPTPQGGGMAPSPGLMMNPAASGGPGGGPPPPPSMNAMPLQPGSAPGADPLFSNEFMQDMAGSLDVNDFMFRSDTDINFERDFGQWFNNPDEVGGMDLKQ